MSTSTAPMDVLADLVRRYQVCWEVWPEYAQIGQNRRQVGFELELLGSDRDLSEFDPGSPKSLAIHAALEAIVEWVLYKEEGVTVEIGQSDQSLCCSPTRGNRPDVSLSIKILHGADFESPVDACERSYLEKAKTRLRQLGAYEHQWHPTTAGADKWPVPA